ncbi:MAG: NAD(P)H-hydrate dehydratase [Bacteroidota bacterium]|nr:NAD(P)H-hydrate dehydratase [Bacteroidota bacterium]
MKILSTIQTKEADAFTIAHEPVASIDLMERAAAACTQWLLEKYGNAYRYFVVCGNGNNGGDGLAIARQLKAKGCGTDVFIARVAEKDSADFTQNLERLEAEKIPYSIISSAEELIFPDQHFVIIDAVFGSGLSREPEGIAANIIDKLNSISADKIAVDIPSGLFGDDNTGNPYKHVVRATYTLSFQYPKLSFMFPENSAYTGNLIVLDIHLHPDYIFHAPASYYYITHEFAKTFLPVRPRFAHKGTFGHALLIAGSEGKMGAAVLSAKACLRSGAGLLTVNIPAVGNGIMQVSVPEVMLQLNESEKIISGRIKTGPGKDDEFSAIGIGPGIGRNRETEQSIKLLLNEYDGPLVFDADAINILSENKTWLAFLPKGTILTPHPGEFDRLTEKHNSGFERMKSQRALAIKNGIYIVLKGAHTSIACPDGTIYFNSSGNPGMATGGSGDVLTGIITGLRAQSFHPQAACILGVYLHGLAGDIAASVQSEHGMIAGDILEQLGGAWRMMEN